MSDQQRRNPFTRAQVSRAEFHYTIHSVVAPDGFEPDEALDPHMWSLVAESERFMVRDEIRVIASDNSWIQRLVVVFRKGSIVHVARESLDHLKVVAIKPKPVKEVSGPRYIAKHQGFGKWGVFDTRGKNDEAQWLEKDLPSKEEAEEKLRSLLNPA